MICSLLDGSYRPNPVLKIEIPKDDGKMRQLGMLIVAYRLVQQAVNQVLPLCMNLISAERVVVCAIVGKLPANAKAIIPIIFFIAFSRFLSDTKVRQVKRKFCNRKWGKGTFFTEFGECLELHPARIGQKGLPKVSLCSP